MTSVQLYCQQCSYEAKRPLLEQVACRGTRETACEPALCPQGHGPMLRKDGVVQQRIGGEWVVTGQGIDRSRYVYEGPNGAVRPNSEHSPNERLRVTLEDRFNYAVTRQTTP